jgi:hypothetical protein
MLCYYLLSGATRDHCLEFTGGRDDSKYKQCLNTKQKIFCNRHLLRIYFVKVRPFIYLLFTSQHDHFTSMRIIRLLYISICICNVSDKGTMWRQLPPKSIHSLAAYNTCWVYVASIETSRYVIDNTLNELN